MDKKLTNNVRQVLMNELGLTRESIRTEMETIVHDTINKYLVRMMDSGRLHRMIKGMVKEEFNGSRRNFPHTDLRKIIALAAAKEAQKFVEKHVTISC